MSSAQVESMSRSQANGNVARLQNIASEIASNMSASGHDQSYLQSKSKITNANAHYEVPNLSSMLYEFTNKEQDQVINAFRINSFVNIRDLPDNIAPTNVIQNIQMKMKEALAQSSVISQNKRVHMEKL